MSEHAAPLPPPPRFDADFRNSLDSLLAWRRDVRRFERTPLDDGMLEELVQAATRAPSVGNSQPWRFVEVASATVRTGVQSEFERCNALALADYSGARAALYARLKLEGLRDAPTQIAVFCDEEPVEGHGLGRRTMPETLRYSVVMAIHSLWLTARARGIGVGWVSILGPEQVEHLLGMPASWRFMAYLCIGRPREEHLDPELERHGWQQRLPLQAVLRRL